MNKESSLKDEPLILTDSNYYSKEANWKYLSVSQYKNFLECEAKALAELKGEWREDIPAKALLVGNYVHSYFESQEAHDEFLKENGDKLYKKDGDLYKDFEIANKMIKRIEREPLFNFLWQGTHEEIITGELFGVEWKGKIDLLNVDKGYFVDLKTTADIYKSIFNTERWERQSFVEMYGYVLQIAVYEQLLEQKYGKGFTGYIYAVSKQDVPDVSAIEVEGRKKQFELEELERTIDRVEEVKTGQVKPEMCGHCSYCRQHKELNGFITTDELLNKPV